MWSNGVSPQDREHRYRRNILHAPTLREIHFLRHNRTMNPRLQSAGQSVQGNRRIQTTSAYLMNDEGRVPKFIIGRLNFRHCAFCILHFPFGLHLLTLCSRQDKIE